MSDDVVKLFSLSTCSHCRSVKKLMDESTVKYEFVDVDLLKDEARNDALADIRKYNPRCSFPTVVIGGQVIIGFKAQEIRAALGL